MESLTLLAEFVFVQPFCERESIVWETIEMKKKTAILACFSLAILVSSVGFANPDDSENPGGRPRLGAGTSDRPVGQNRPIGQSKPIGQDRTTEAGRRFGSDRPNGAGPAQFVTMLMRQFDKDGDQKLDSQELVALLTSMRERQAQMGGQGQMGPMANRFRPGGPDGDGNNAAGGVTPKRPPVEE